jgi:Uma2 family endonuclease
MVMEARNPTTRRWTRAEYARLIDDGYFQPDERAELIDGEILVMTPQKSRHSTGVRLAQRYLERTFGPAVEVRPQLPFAIEPDSEPEPDIVVVAGSIRDYVTKHPDKALLIVEVSDSTLPFDRRVKGPLYARAHVPEYWIVNLVENLVEVYREPIETATGWTYRLVQQRRAGETITPLHAAEAVAVADLLP